MSSSCLRSLSERLSHRWGSLLRSFASIVIAAFCRFSEDPEFPMAAVSRSVTVQFRTVVPSQNKSSGPMAGPVSSPPTPLLAVASGSRLGLRWGKCRHSSWAHAHQRTSMCGCMHLQGPAQYCLSTVDVSDARTAVFWHGGPVRAHAIATCGLGEMQAQGGRGRRASGRAPRTHLR